MKRETQWLGSSSVAMDGGAVTWGGGTGTGNTTGSTKSFPRGRGGVGVRVNERPAGRAHVPSATVGAVLCRPLLLV